MVTVRWSHRHKILTRRSRYNRAPGDEWMDTSANALSLSRDNCATGTRRNLSVTSSHAAQPLKPTVVDIVALLGNFDRRNTPKTKRVVAWRCRKHTPLLCLSHHCQPPAASQFLSNQLSVHMTSSTNDRWFSQLRRNFKFSLICNTCYLLMRLSLYLWVLVGKVGKIESQKSYLH